MPVFSPQPGPQTQFLSTPADIAIYGGSAGSGKSFALELDPLRHIHNPQFGAVIFRRTTPEIRNQGGLWDSSLTIYPYFGAIPKRSVLEHHFPSGARVSLRHLEHADDVHGWQGSQIPAIYFDELTHFLESQFWYMLSRNRSTCGVRPYMRCTTNPDADSWVATLIEWWIDQETGFPIQERSGVIRWFIRVGNDLVWADTPRELIDTHGDPSLPDDHKDQPQPYSLTFIAAKLEDNPALLGSDPRYRARLLALPYVERMRLLHGNWIIKPAAGLMFKRSWFGMTDAVPAEAAKNRVIAWDFAATLGGGDWTVAVVASKTPDGQIYIEHVHRLQGSYLDVDKAMLKMAEQYPGARFVIPQDPAQAGKDQAGRRTNLLHGKAVVKAYPVTGDKAKRAGGISAMAEQGNVRLVRAPWNKAFLDELESFPDSRHDDQVDALSLADYMLSRRQLSGPMGAL